MTLAAIRDNTLYEDAGGALSNGSGPTLFAGRTSQAVGSIRRGLIAFDLSGIPAGSTIASAVLTLHMSQASGAGTQSVSLHRALAGWGEGASDAGASGGVGAPAAPGDATWIHTFRPSSFWGAAGGDFAAAATAAQSIGGVASYSWGPTSEMTADAQQWLDDPSTNHGWLLRGNEAVGATSRRFDAREHPESAVRPSLAVEFTPPPTAIEPSAWGAIKGLFR